MAILIGIALALLSIGVVLYPFFKPRAALLRQAPPATPDDDGPDLESVYEAIQTLQLERQLGNVTEGLYREQLEGYRLQAAVILRRRREGPDQAADLELEQEIKVARVSLAPSNGGSNSCPNCDTNLESSLAQCPECGVELPAGGGTSQERS